MAERIHQALQDWFALENGHERLLSALHYYRHAIRLAEFQPDHVALVPEILLNLTKAIEILMTAKRDTVRTRARSWGISDHRVEEWIIPLLLVRNQIDVAHGSFGPLGVKERDIMLEFKEASIVRVGVVLKHILDGVQQGQIVLEPVSGSLDSERRRLLNAISVYVGKPDAQSANSEP